VAVVADRHGLDGCIRWCPFVAPARQSRWSSAGPRGGGADSSNYLQGGALFGVELFLALGRFVAC
jgi:hypothetical protein